MIRVVAGKYRHRNLESPSLDTTRPTKDAVREAVFSAVGDNVINKRVLDLFAGSGAMGIEALSRGASFCYFVDIDKLAVETINKNLKTLQIKNAKVLRSDYLAAINTLIFNKEKIDIVIMDPPYKDDVYAEALSLLETSGVLSDDAIIVLESDHELNIDLSRSRAKNYKYGKAHIRIIWKNKM